MIKSITKGNKLQTSAIGTTEHYSNANFNNKVTAPPNVDSAI